MPGIPSTDPFVEHWVKSDRDTNAMGSTMPASGGSHGGATMPSGSVRVEMKEGHREAVATDRLPPQCVSSGYTSMEATRLLAQASSAKLGRDLAAAMDWADQSAAGGSSMGMLLTSPVTEAEIPTRKGVSSVWPR
uniref:Uncharacterized protein n=1 Tax=Arundo donax TaxID=35708 RepID=A0A0A9HQ99_ARUDO